MEYSFQIRNPSETINNISHVGRVGRWVHKILVLPGALCWCCTVGPDTTGSTVSCGKTSFPGASASPTGSSLPPSFPGATGRMREVRFWTRPIPSGTTAMWTKGAKRDLSCPIFCYWIIKNVKTNYLGLYLYFYLLNFIIIDILAVFLIQLHNAAYRRTSSTNC